MTARFQIAKRSDHEAVRAEDARRVSVMRRLVKARLSYCGLSRMADDVVLIVSELVTNSIKHSGGTQITLTMRVRDGFLRLSVKDGMPGRPEIQDANGESETGRGLEIVEWITAARHGNWGISDDGTTTWCSLAITGEGK
ncbi:ATP-binding protein [Streptomyces albulus]|nr:ATP-binding protein [Streptomyces noursei]